MGVKENLEAKDDVALFKEALRAESEQADEYRDILKLVAEMRHYQKAYFKTREQKNLIESKRLESRVDTLLGDAGIKWP